MRIERVLQRIVNEGRLFGEIVMLIESSARTKALITQHFSQYAFQINGQTVPLSHYFMTKSANEPGLVVADFIAHTAGATVRAKLQGRIKNYHERRDATHIFTPQDSRWVDFLEVNTVQIT